MSPKAPRPTIDEHEIRIASLEAEIHGSPNDMGLLKRTRELEDERLKNTTTRQVIVAVGSALITVVIAVAPVLAYLGPRIERLTELLEKKPSASAPAPGRVQ